jgi:uncharacterized protein YjlB
MDIIAPVKRLAEKVTGIGLPDPQVALACVHECRASRMAFRDDGYIPNNSHCALLHYKTALRFVRRHDPAAILEQIFEAHDWGQAWRNGIYDFVHYHSMTHEVLGIARGSAKLRLGGNKGRTVEVSVGDVIIIPAGVGHECLKASKSFLVVGAYPPKRNLRRMLRKFSGAREGNCIHPPCFGAQTTSALRKSPRTMVGWERTAIPACA